MGILSNKVGIQLELREALKGIKAPIEVDEPVVLPMPAEANLDGAADLPTTVAKVNAILAKLRTAGLLDV